MSELKPCPCCGSLDIKQEKHIELLYQIERDIEFFDVKCNMCGLKIVSFDSMDDANSKWNTRQPDPRIAELEAVRDGLAHSVTNIISYLYGDYIPKGRLWDSVLDSIKKAEATKWKVG